MTGKTGQKVHLPASKTYFSKDIKFTRDTPIFCTSKEELSFVRGGVLDERESHGTLPVLYRAFTMTCSVKTIESKSQRQVCFTQK